MEQSIENFDDTRESNTKLSKKAQKLSSFHTADDFFPH